MGGSSCGPVTVEENKKMFEPRVSAGATQILPGWDKPHTKTVVWSCDMEGHAKKYISAGDVGPDHAKGSDTHMKTVTGDTVGDPLKGHFWTCFVQCDEAAILSSCLGQPLLRIEFQGRSVLNEVTEDTLCFFFHQTMCGLRGLFVPLHCLAFLGLILLESGFNF